MRRDAAAAAHQTTSRARYRQIYNPKQIGPKDITSRPMEPFVWKSNYPKTQVSFAHNLHKMSSLLGGRGALFVADDCFPETPYIHAA